MADSEWKFLIGTEGDFPDNIVVSVLGRAHPQYTDFWDGNWLSVKVAIQAGGFKGNYAADFRNEELARFHAALVRLYAAQEGVAAFETMEGQLSLKLTRDRLGHIAVEGIAQDDAGIGNKLHFHFGIDQTYLPALIAELDEILDKFPVIGKRDLER
jgi:hypothetical protein